MLAYLSHPNCLRHDMGDEHPEQALRLQSIEDAIQAANLNQYLQQVAVNKAAIKAIKAVHRDNYIDFLKKNSPLVDYFLIDSDTTMNCHTLEAALTAAGSVINAVDYVMNQENDINKAFCAIRPPGHHAESDRAMGFCFFNNLAIGVQHAIDQYAIKKIAIVDFDVHHGNGTESIFIHHPNVLFCSSYEELLFPFSELLVDHPNVIHMPLKMCSGGKKYRELFNQIILPRLNEFEPDMIFISAGFDAHKADEISSINLLENDFYWITEQLVKVAEKTAKGRVISVLEGGYDIPTLGVSVVAHLKALLKQPFDC